MYKHKNKILYAYLGLKSILVGKPEGKRDHYEDLM
jgi:hypothetical protein